MPVSQTLVFSATPPTTGETPTVFNANAIACWNDLKLNIVPDMNTAFTQMNDLETNVNTKEASAVAASATAVMAANFQGTWTSQTTVIGQSWEYLGVIYGVLIAGNTSPIATPSNWIALTTAQSIKNTPSGGISATTVQEALNELDTEKSPIASPTFTGTVNVGAGGIIVDGNLVLKQQILFEGATADAFETTLTVTDPTADRTITLPDASGTVAFLASPALTGTPTAPTAAVGTNTTQIATTEGVRAEIPNMLNATGSAPLYACRAWVNLNGTGTVAIRASGNVSSITDNGVGDFTTNFITAMPDGNYAMVGATVDNSNFCQFSEATMTVSSARFLVRTLASALNDPSVCCITFNR